jgi:hypothetical protein
MATLLGFDAKQVEPLAEMEVLPAGKYNACIVESEMKPTKAGNGNYLQFTFEVLDGECKGRKIWARLNLENPNPVAVQMARAELSALCRAVGVLEPKDSVELHNLPLVLTLSQKTGADGEVYNRIKSYAKKESGAQPAKPQQASDATPPWRRPA